MGVHDFSCVICGTGEQCNINHINCIGKKERCDVDESFSEDSEHGYGADAKLICFDLPSKITCRKKAFELFKTGKATNLRIMSPDYSWDSWDFMDNEEPMGYASILNPDDYTLNDSPNQLIHPWKTSNEFRENYPYKKHFWCMAVCYVCYDTFLTYKKINTTELCSIYCISLADANGIKSGRKSKIYRILRKKYQWLRHIIRSI